ncbi:MAG: hypothetical protein ACFFAO_05975 [Candidatus Hermodarchaeota archaeon]
MKSQSESKETKKRDRIVFRITPTLKKELEDFVEEKKKGNLEQVEYKSVSSFCYHIIKNALMYYKKGLTFDDFKNVPDSEVKDIFKKFTFLAVTDFYEQSVSMNKYSDNNIGKIPLFVFNFRNWIFDKMEETNVYNLEPIFERVRIYLLKNNLTRDVTIDFFTQKGKNYYNAIMEYSGKHKNLHYENCKAMAGILGVLGFKLEDFSFSETDLYARFDLVETSLFKEKKRAQRERFNLLNYNINYLVNYYRIIHDKDLFFWQKVADDKEIFLTFRDEIILNNWMNKIVDDFQKFGPRKDLLLSILKVFEKFHWILIENEEDLSFRMRIMYHSDQTQKQFKTLFKIIEEKYGKDEDLEQKISNLLEIRHTKEEHFVLKTLKKYSTVKKKEDIYYVEKI